MLPEYSQETRNQKQLRENGLTLTQLGSSGIILNWTTK